MRKLLALICATCLLSSLLYCGVPILAQQNGAEPETFVQSFEDEALSLNAGNFTFSTEEARTGSKSLKMVKESANTNTNSFAAVFKEEADKLKANTPYSAYFYIKTLSGHSEIELSFFRNDTLNSHSGNSSSDRVVKYNLTEWQISNLPADENGWRKVVIDSEFYLDEAKPYMNLWSCQWAGDATFYIDDITFEPIVAPEIEENLLEADAEHWTLGRAWSQTGFDGEILKVTGGTGIATFIGKKVSTETIRVELSSNVTKDWAAIAFRNQADLDTIKADGQKAYFYEVGSAYAVQWTKDGKLSLKLSYKEGDNPKWDNITEPVDFNMSDGNDHTIEIKTTDDTDANSTYIEVYVDGILRLSATDTQGAVKPAGFVQVVASHESDSLQVKGFEIEGEKVSDYVKPIIIPEIEENLLEADQENWVFGKEWSETGFDGETIKITGGTGIATFVGKKVSTETVRVKLSSSVTADWAAIAFRNQADLDTIKVNGQKAYFYDIGNSYIVQWTKDGKLSLKLSYKEGEEPKWKNIAGPIDFNMADGNDHTVEIMATDDTEANSTYIEVYVDGVIRLTGVDTEGAVKPAGFVQIVASHENDSVTVKGFEIVGEKVADYTNNAEEFKPKTEITENLFSADSQNWIFGKEWSPTTGIKDGVLTVTGGTGIATFVGKKVDTQSIILKLSAKLDNEWAAVSFRNSVSLTNIEKNGQNAYFMTTGNSYALVFTKTGVSVKVSYEKDKWEDIGKGYDIDLSDGKEHIYQIVTEDYPELKATVIKVYIDGTLCIDCTDTKYAVKDAGYVSFVCSNKADSITVSGFEIDGEKVSDYKQGAPAVMGSNLVKNTDGWFFNKGWVYPKYTGTTGISNGKIVVSGDYGTALYKGQKLGENYAELKFTTKLSDKGMIFIGLRNAVTAEQLGKDGKSASTMSAESGAYVIRINKSGIALGIKGKEGNFETLGTAYSFASGFDITAGENTLITRVVDDADNKNSRIEIWLNGERIMVYIDNEHAVKPNGYYSITVADGKTNTDSITVSSLKIGKSATSPYTGQAPLSINIFLCLLMGCSVVIVLAFAAARKRG